MDFDGYFKNLKLYGFQRRGCKTGLKHLLSSDNAFLLCDEQGLGKTIQAIGMAIALKRRKLIDRVLVVAPLSAVDEWVRMIENYTKQSYVAVKDNAGIDSRAFFTIMGYDRFRILHERIPIERFGLLICDEFHNIKSPQAKRTQAITSYRLPYVLFLSGTPILNRTSELWTALNYIDPDNFGSYKDFFYRYTIVRKIRIWVKRKGRRPGYEYYIDKPIGAKNVEELREILKIYMLRRLKRKVYKELPEKIYQTLSAPLRPKQRRIYDKLKKELIVKIRDRKITIKGALSMFTRLRQVCCSLSTLGEDGSSKIDMLEGFAKDNLYGEHKFVILTPFVSVAEEIAERLAEYSPVCVTGKTKNVTTLRNRFQEDKNCRVYTGTIAKNKEAITLTAADFFIFIGKSLVQKINEQAEDRVHRIGQKKAVNVVSIVSPDTIDERIEEILQQKRKIFAEVVEEAGTLERIRSLMED